MGDEAERIIEDGMTAMWMDDEQKCPECGHWKKPGFDLCYECNQYEQEAREEAVGVAYLLRKADTTKAVLFKIEPGFTGRSVWVPKSLLREGAMEDKYFWVPRWFADQEDLEYVD